MSVSPIFVKICGLRDVGSARVAVESGADALGFILAPSRRQVTPQAVSEIRRELALCVQGVPTVVGVVVNAAPDDIATLVSDSGVDMIQLSGDESPDLLAGIGVPVIKALRFPNGMATDDALRAVDRWLDAPNPARHIIVEGHVDGTYGGTGTRADWTLVAEIGERYPVILAGGLDPGNVRGAISAVRPFGVDVSSGVETDGVKDHARIRSFIDASRTG